MAFRKGPIFFFAAPRLFLPPPQPPPPQGARENIAGYTPQRAPTPLSHIAPLPRDCAFKQTSVPLNFDLIMCKNFGATWKKTRISWNKKLTAHWKNRRRHPPSGVTSTFIGYLSLFGGPLKHFGIGLENVFTLTSKQYGFRNLPYPMPQHAKIVLFPFSSYMIRSCPSKLNSDTNTDGLFSPCCLLQY